MGYGSWVQVPPTAEKGMNFGSPFRFALFYFWSDVETSQNEESGVRWGACDKLELPNTCARSIMDKLLYTANLTKTLVPKNSKRVGCEQRNRQS